MAIPATHYFYHGEKVAIVIRQLFFLADKPSAIVELYSISVDI